MSPAVGLGFNANPQTKRGVHRNNSFDFRKPIMQHRPKSKRLHRALQNSDIIECILQHLGPGARAAGTNIAKESNNVQLEDIADQKEWNSLTMCTRVSRAFSGPAYRLLWRELPSLTPLLRLCILLDTEYQMLDESTIAIDVTGQGWQRFAELASFVRRIIIGYEENSPYLSAILHLARINAGQPLLPAVQEIRCTGCPDIDTIIYSIAGSSLRKLLVRADFCDWASALPTSDAAQRLLYKLPQRMPDLRSLCVRAHDLQYSKDVGSSIRSLRKLSSLRIHWKSSSLRELLDDYMDVAFSLESLCDLALPIAKWEGTPRRDIYGFPPLQRLCLMGSNVYGSYISALYPLTKSSPLEVLEVLELPLHARDERCVAEEYDTVISGLLATCADTLTVVKLDLGTSSTVSIPAASFLQPLRQLRRLRVCKIHWHDGLTFGAGDLGDAASAWPHLTKFALFWGWWSEMDAAPLFEDIVRFMCACPQLAKLQLPGLAFADMGPLDSTSVRSLPQSCTIAELSVGDPSRLARTLRSLLPSLRRVDQALRSATPRWRLVLSELSVLIRVRSR